MCNVNVKLLILFYSSYVIPSIYSLIIFTLHYIHYDWILQVLIKYDAAFRCQISIWKIVEIIIRAQCRKLMLKLILQMDKWTTFIRDLFLGIMTVCGQYAIAAAISSGYVKEEQTESIMLKIFYWPMRSEKQPAMLCSIATGKTFVLCS